MRSKVYRFYNEFGTLLYVGMSSDIIARLGAHKAMTEWFDHVTDIKIENFTSKNAALKAENNAIINEKPLFNVTASVKLGNVRGFIGIYELAEILNMKPGTICNYTYRNKFPIPFYDTEPFKWSVETITEYMNDATVVARINEMRR